MEREYIEHFESSGTKIMMCGLIVFQLCELERKKRKGGKRRNR